MWNQKSRLNGEWCKQERSMELHMHAKEEKGIRDISKGQNWAERESVLLNEFSFSLLFYFR